MKKLCAIALLFLSFTSAFAQTELHFGLKAAPSLAWIRTDSKDFTSDGSKFGFSYGLITEFNFTERYAFATGLDVAYRGGRLKSITTVPISGGDSIVSIATKYNIQFIELPLTLKLKTNEIGMFTYFLQFGVSPGINIRGKGNLEISIQTPTATTSSTEDVDIKDGINVFNLSMVVGGGLEYTLSGSTTLLAGVQFNNGFLDVFDDKNLKANSNYLALTIGILF